VLLGKMLNSALSPPPCTPVGAAVHTVTAGQPRLTFANQLRGVAAILVVATHLFGTYFVAPGYVSGVTFSRDLGLVEPDWVPYFHPSFSGPLGVALFCLISGFVIPCSLMGKPALGFLLSRFFRIIPTYCTALAISMLALHLSARYWDNIFRHSAREIVANALLIHHMLGTESVDPVNWTLSVEVKFYLLMAVCGRWLLRSSLLPCLYFLGAALAVAAASPSFPKIASMLALELNYVIFMLIGTTFFQHYRAIIGTRALWLRSTLLFALFAASWSLGPQRAQFPDITMYYLYALLLFALAYRLRERFRPVALLDFLADISFPLYALHSLAGWVLLKLLMGNGMAFGPALTLTGAAIVGVAWLLHRAVEMPSNRLGKRLATALFQ
jgi:peptidoglycan/LPS O-acetylase OafA/YrhL